MTWPDKGVEPGRRVPAHHARTIWIDPIFGAWPWATLAIFRKSPPTLLEALPSFSLMSDVQALARSASSTAVREYHLDRSLGSVVGLLSEMNGLSTSTEEEGESARGLNTVCVRMHGQSIELQHLDADELGGTDQNRLRLCVTLVPQGEQTTAALSVHEPSFLDAMVRGDIVPEAVGWCAALAISFFQGLLSASFEAALVSFGISALGLLAVRIGTAYSVWKRARRCLRQDLTKLLSLVHRQLAPVTKNNGARY